MIVSQYSILTLEVNRVGTFVVSAELTTVTTAPDDGMYETQLQPVHYMLENPCES